MNISLRKANAVQNSILEAIRGIKLEFTIGLNQFQDPAAELKRVNDELMNNDARRQRLLMSLYNIRGLVGAANTNCGIDLKLATAAFIEKRISQLEELARAETITDLKVITGQLEKIRNRKEDSHGNYYGRSDVVMTGVVTSQQADQAKAEILKLKKEKLKLNDELLELNIKTEIPLSEEVVSTLQEEGLI